MSSDDHGCPSHLPDSTTMPRIIIDPPATDAVNYETSNQPPKNMSPGATDGETVPFHLSFAYSPSRYPSDLAHWSPISYVISSATPLRHLSQRLKAAIVFKAKTDFKLTGYLRRKHMLIFWAHARLRVGSELRWVDLSDAEKRVDAALLAGCLNDEMRKRGVEVGVECVLRDEGKPHGYWEMEEVIFPYRPWERATQTKESP